MRSKEIRVDSIMLAGSRRAILAYFISLKIRVCRSIWVVQSVKRPTSTQVMISRFVSSSPASGSVLTARSLEPASDSVSPSLSAPPPLMLCLSLKNKQTLKKKKMFNCPHPRSLRASLGIQQDECAQAELGDNHLLDTPLCCSVYGQDRKSVV